MRQQALDWILAAAQRPDPALEPEFDIADDERREAKKVRNLHRHDPLFWDDWFARSGLDALVRDHLRKPRLLRHAAFIKRHADESYIPLHQDIALWEKRYESAQTFWVALTPSRNDNGGMFYYPDDRTIFPTSSTSPTRCSSASTSRPTAFPASNWWMPSWTPATSWSGPPAPHMAATTTAAASCASACRSSSSTTTNSTN
nr:phytanoyl-CoA dioxygenase family protein [Pseudomonas aeruginosa]